MSRFKNLFGKSPDRQSASPPHRERVLSKDQHHLEHKAGSVADALSEIEAEDFSLETDSIEDQLVQLENHPALSEVEAPDEYETDFDGVKKSVDKIEGESRSLHTHLSRLEKDIDKLMSAHESLSHRINQSLEAKKEPVREEVHAPRKERFAPFRRTQRVEEQRVEEHAPIEVDDELPPFRPFGLEDTVSFVPAGPSEPKIVFPAFEPSIGHLPQMALIEEFKPGIKQAPQVPEAPLPPTVEGSPILTHIRKDYLTLTLVMRWIEFLFERITRDKISLALDYYVEIGWISEDVKHEIMSIARGEMQDVTKYMAHEEAATAEEALGEEVGAIEAAPAIYKKIEDWRLAADDHLKSLLFICNIAGIKVDKDRLNSLELMIQRFKESLENFHGV
jgi:flagellar protein FlaD